MAALPPLQLQRNFLCWNLGVKGGSSMVRLLSLREVCPETLLGDVFISTLTKFSELKDSESGWDQM